MITMPLPDLIQKIKESSGLSDEEINKRIKEKLEVLSGLISKEGAAHIIANELGISLQLEGPVQIKSIMPGMRNAEVTGKVVRKYELREFAREDRKGQVASLVIGDKTGTVRLVLWNDQADQFALIKEGDILRIANALVKDNAGRKELHLNSSSKLIINPKGVAIDLAEQGVAVRKKIVDLAAGEDNVELFGTIVQVFDLRFFETCPTCQKRLQKEKGACEVHGVVAPDYSYVLNLFLDDGSGNTRVVLWKNQVQKLLGVTDTDVKAFRSGGFDKVKSDLLGNFVKLVGRVNKNEGFDSLEFIPRLVFTDPDPKLEIEAAKKSLPEVKKEEKKEERKAPESKDMLRAVNEDDDFFSIDEEEFLE